ncbi:hypothetical protein HOP50_04g32640 [Chloropicon primus]|uniref:EGF-like domain-containing protein n=1 Tax=Chloropicon primus TaxID=1764295 RepID=A0A5B8MN33_9CHLO|nr:hypothetical protein A3770_04p32600 [Chloropicon primus]UPQ99954.1 hypothetical protein HOP50_04g32640 [Chloropicon primus]|mmetsp:Transcript_10936/g.30736  ORF Transcript_10936/g.30736 Transcript_10936/m.30736 type:complete len:565 (+) Transcript_10936:98-1792(+)|eukprot:QDZ20742.1 hypothetical protein A3770_04p32600 [Chloropicon primus]
MVPRYVLLALCSLTLAVVAVGGTRVANELAHDLRGSYYGSYSEAGGGEEQDEPFSLPRSSSPGKSTAGTAVLCLCSSESVGPPSIDEAGDYKFLVDGVLAFLQNDKIGQRYALRGEIRCELTPQESFLAHASGERLCHYVSKGAGGEYDVSLALDVARGVPSGSGHAAFFNISSDANGEYTGHIGSKLSALDSVCDDIACRMSVTRNYVVETGTGEDESEDDDDALSAPSAPSAPSALPGVQPTVVVEEEDQSAAQVGGSYGAGRDGSVAQNRVGKLRCGGTTPNLGASKTPDCGDQGFCMDEVTGAACYWDCNPGWCSCTSGTCFDAEGRCTVPSTYPAANGYQSTCSYGDGVGGGSPEAKREVKEIKPTETPAEAVRVAFHAGRDGATPPNRVESLRCGGEKGRPSCGDMGFCLDEKTGERCFWDCDPGWCSCNSGACFDFTGRCTESATYPESNNWQATCEATGQPPEGGSDISDMYTSGKDGARPPNRVGKRRCGGEKGKPDCGLQGYCMGEETGEACYWDCEPGWCSCTSGSCFDELGRCSIPASYPESNNWQATCPFY